MSSASSSSPAAVRIFIHVHGLEYHVVQSQNAVSAKYAGTAFRFCRAAWCAM